MSSPSPQLRRVLVLAVSVFLTDQISKSLIRRFLEPDMPYRGDVFFHFTHQRNEGLMGGAFSDVPVLPYLAPFLAFCLLIYMYRILDPSSRVQGMAYGMILGGALGNNLDRIRVGSVTDFLQFHFLFIPFNFPWKYYPAFNVADSAILVGVAVLALTWHKAAPADDSGNT